jgi:hypothetical protein
MFFAYAIDDRSLAAFASLDRVIAHAEKVDVEAGVWLFFGEDGAPLRPVLEATLGHDRARYSLTPVVAPELPRLSALLAQVASVDGDLHSVEQVREVLTIGSSDHGSRFL